ncbi:MAG: hypothetical protein GOP50_10105 [Candidatus Heimdallarchaeota archaeon]|nr:hypothetical protein [Candidatus Heimdallarchaeota archaeon]
MHKEKPISMFQFVWNSIKPLAYLILEIGILLLLAYLFMLLIQKYDKNNISFLVLIILVLIVMFTFVLGFIVILVRKIVIFLIQKEELNCANCGQSVLKITKFCPSCGNEIRDE